MKNKHKELNTCLLNKVDNFGYIVVLVYYGCSIVNIMTANNTLLLLLVVVVVVVVLLLLPSVIKIPWAKSLN